MLHNANHRFVPVSETIEVRRGTGFPLNPAKYDLFRVDSDTTGGLYWYSGAQWMKYCLPDKDLIVGETPAGTLDGANKVFTLANTPVKVLYVALNGLIQDVGATNDYTISGSTITMVTAPTTTDKIRVAYFK